jgi:hypothetical protein
MLVILIAVYLFLIRPSQLRWGSTREEVRQAMPGDGLIANPTFVATRAITIRGRPEEIWPWIVQMGFNRAGYYGYDLIENLGSKTGIRSAAAVVPELQHPRTGDVLPISSVAHLTFGTIQPDRYLIWQSEAEPHDGAFTWALYPIDQNHTRLISRIRLRYHWTSRALALDLFTEFADHVAVPKILVGVRNRVEGRASDSLPREAIELAVWILALLEMAIAIVLVFRWRKWWRAWGLALGSGSLLMFVLYAHAPIWIGGAFGCGIALMMFRLSLRWVKFAYPALMILLGVALAPMLLPILPTDIYIRYATALHVEPPAIEKWKLGPLPQIYASQFGWEEMVATVAGVYNCLLPDVRSKTAIFAQNFGQAGAIDLFGPKYGLPKAISVHQNYFLWGPRDYTGDCDAGAEGSIGAGLFQCRITRPCFASILHAQGAL